MDEFDFDKFQAFLASSLLGSHSVIQIFNRESTDQAVLRYRKPLSDDLTPNGTLSIEILFTFSGGKITTNLAFLQKRDSTFHHYVSMPLSKQAVFQHFDQAGFVLQDQEENLAKTMAFSVKTALKLHSIIPDESSIQIKLYNHDLEKNFDLTLDRDTSQDSLPSRYLAETIFVYSQQMPEPKEAKEIVPIALARWKKRFVQGTIASHATVSTKASVKTKTIHAKHKLYRRGARAMKTLK